MVVVVQLPCHEVRASKLTLQKGERRLDNHDRPTGCNSARSLISIVHMMMNHCSDKATISCTNTWSTIFFCDKKSHLCTFSDNSFISSPKQEGNKTSHRSPQDTTPGCRDTGGLVLGNWMLQWRGVHFAASNWLWNGDGWDGDNDEGILSRQQGWCRTFIIVCSSKWCW